MTDSNTPFHVVSDSFNPFHSVKLITTDQNRAFEQINAMGAQRQEALLATKSASELFEQASLKDIAKTMDDESWAQFSAFMRQRIEHLREREEEHQLSIPPAIFQMSHVDLPLEAIYFRLDNISDHRKNNANDLESAQELIESAMIERFDRPAVEERFTPQTWKNELFEHRLDEDFEAIQHEHEYYSMKESALFPHVMGEEPQHGLSEDRKQWMTAKTAIIESQRLLDEHPAQDYSLETSVGMR